VSVVVTLVFIALVAMWSMTVVRRLGRLRTQVMLAWEKLEANQSNDAIRTVYNKHVALYNDALAAFPANVIGPSAGFKPARPFNPEPKSEIRDPKSEI
jgi:hypothetical protein